MWNRVDLQRADGDEKRIGNDSLEHHTGWRGCREREVEEKERIFFSEKQGGKNEALPSSEGSSQKQASGRSFPWLLLAASSLHLRKMGIIGPRMELLQGKR